MNILTGNPVARFSSGKPRFAASAHSFTTTLCFVALAGLLLGSLLFAACARSDAASGNAARYAFKGVVKAVNPPKRQATIKHEKVGDYMDAMTMPFLIKDETALKQMRPGDTINATLVVTEDGAQWLENIRIQRELAVNSPQQEAK